MYLNEKKPGKVYKSCIVPCCSNTSTSTPEKVFIYLPKDSKKRRKWLIACRRDGNSLSKLSTAYCCEDHFNLQEDMENWFKYNLMGGPIKMKPNVVPHRFDCQKDRKTGQSTPFRPLAAKRLHADTISVALGTSTSGIEADVQHNLEVESEDDQESCIGISPQLTSDVEVQVHTKFRSKQTQIRSCVSDIATSPIKIHYVNSMTSPIKFLKKRKVSATCDESSSEEDMCESDEFSLSESSSDDLDAEFLDEFDSIERKQVAIARLNVFNRNPKLYMGIPENCRFILDLLQRKTNLEVPMIMLTLKKIRLNECFAILSDDFGISSSTASRMFHAAVPKIAQCLKQLIIWPAKKKILELLPIPFRSRYSNVQSIIDCLEVEIEKPSDPVKQALTWSEYKSANTLKYLVSSTPDGLINYISTGFGGRISDSLLVEQCDYLKNLPSHCAVMADRGFKHIDSFLGRKGCTLIRPPSVKSGEKSTKKEVMETKKIASLRIHVERVIRRIREYKILVPHACIDHNLVTLMDDVIIISCGLINLQAPLIK